MDLLANYDWSLVWEYRSELLHGLLTALEVAAVALVISATTPLPSSLQWWSVAVGLILSSGVGIFFGIWPALKAARLNPIDALRYE